MSTSFDIQSALGSYRVEIEKGLYDSLLKSKDDGLIMCDERFAPDFEKAGRKLIAIGAFEENKSLNVIPDIIIQMRRMGINRGTRLTAVGGGIVQDVAAFCAAIYMRGLTWEYMPTTLLGMADSCIGGKSSINVGEFKNIVGTFNPPSRVLVDPSLIESLSAGQKAAGLIEAAKICYCRKAWKAYAAHNPSLAMSSEAATPVIAESLAAKKWFIETDEFDKGDRLLLNFGHTFGHAFEGASHFAISHGIGVGIGILCAGILAKELHTKIESEWDAFEAHVKNLLKPVDNLPEIVRALQAEDILERFKSDKKHERDNYRIVIPSGAGTELLVLPKSGENDRMILLVMREVIASF